MNGTQTLADNNVSDCIPTLTIIWEEVHSFRLWHCLHRLILSRIPHFIHTFDWTKTSALKIINGNYWMSSAFNMFWSAFERWNESIRISKQAKNITKFKINEKPSCHLWNLHVAQTPRTRYEHDSFQQTTKSNKKMLMAELTNRYSWKCALSYQRPRNKQPVNRKRMRR